MDNMEMKCYVVGEKYDKVMETDGAIFELYEENGFISITMTNLSDKEITALNEGALDIYLSVIEGIVFVVADFKDMFIFDMPFNYGLYKEFKLKDPAPYGFTVPIVAVEGSDNVIKAMRVVGLDADFSRKLYTFAEKQWQNKMENYDEKLKSVYERYSAQDIIKYAIAKNVARRIVV